ncbi:MAG TPA: hypothetical protein VMR50_19465 [Myxococcota bacterium]|nr:hypothetical protein [Myxococcota bacterium]
MRTVPSVKATFFQFAADEVERLLRANRVTRASLEQFLEPGDFLYLGKRLAVTSWVPIAAHARLVDVIVSVEAPGNREDFLRCMGAFAAPLVRKLGFYQQLQASSAKYGPSGVGRIFASIGTVVYNFSRWSFEDHDDVTQARMVVDEAREFPDCFRFTSEGFLGYFWKLALDRHDVSVRSERVARERIVFMVREHEGEKD